MANGYKDHSSIGASRNQRLTARLVITVLLVTVGVLGYKHWALLTSHRDTTTKLSLVKADLNAELESRADLTKMLDECKDELKVSRDTRRQLKDNEATLSSRLKMLQDAQQGLINEKTLLKDQLNTEIVKCQETSKQKVSNCDAACELKIEKVRMSADEACQIQKAKQIPVIHKENEIPQNPNELNDDDGDDDDQQNPPHAN